jgi:hypothetical protein
MHRDRTARIIDLGHVVVEEHAKTNQHTGKHPMITEEFAETKAHGAVIATSPASIPLQAIVMSGLPKRQYQNIIAEAEPATAARLVFIATFAMRRSVAPRVEQD